MCSRNQFLFHFTQQMKVIINCGKSDILKSKQVVSLVKRFSNKLFQCLQSSPPASTRSLQLPLVQASVLLLKINFIITLSKFTAETLACGSWFHSHFDNVMMQFLINQRTDALKTDVNLLIYLCHQIRNDRDKKMVEASGQVCLTLVTALTKVFRVKCLFSTKYYQGWQVRGKRIQSKYVPGLGPSVMKS